VAEEVAKSPGPFDVRLVKSLVTLMTQHDLSEVDIRDGAMRLRLRRGHAPVISGGTSGMPVAAPPPPPPAALKADPAAAKTPAPAKQLIEVKSPTPGTFYAAPNPESEVFVRVGSRVTPSTVVCLIEAMKIFNEITADCNGVITEVLAENGQSVEYGQVLFRVDPTG